jgi:hypothetical protein
VKGIKIVLLNDFNIKKAIQKEEKSLQSKFFSGGIVWKANYKDYLIYCIKKITGGLILFGKKYF